MANLEVTQQAAAGHIHDRIGPIFDPAFLRLIPEETLREIVQIRVNAHVAGLKAELAAAEHVAKVVEKFQIRK